MKKLKILLNTPFVRYTGEDDKEINTIAIINGSGRRFFFAISKAKGADCIITGDTTYHYISDVKRRRNSSYRCRTFCHRMASNDAFWKKIRKIT